jgi:hypothetical protein
LYSDKEGIGSKNSIVRVSIMADFKGTESRDFSPKPLKITSGSFIIFSKVHRDICGSRCTTGINNTSGK